MLTKVYLLSVFLAASVQCQGGYGGEHGGGSMSKIVNAAVISNQQVSFKEVPSRSHTKRTSVFINSAPSPIDLIFRSSSTPVNIKLQHNPGKGSKRRTFSKDAPHQIVHTVTKPIIQLVREIIRPRRIVRQQILPVQEEIKTIISRSKLGAQGGSSSAGDVAGPDFGTAVDTDADFGSDDGADADFGSAAEGDNDLVGADQDFGNEVIGNDFGAVDGSDDDGADQGGFGAGGASRPGGPKRARGGNRRPYQDGKKQAGAAGYGSQGGAVGYGSQYGTVRYGSNVMSQGMNPGMI